MGEPSLPDKQAAYLQYFVSGTTYEHDELVLCSTLLQDGIDDVVLLLLRNARWLRGRDIEWHACGNPSQLYLATTSRRTDSAG